MRQAMALLIATYKTKFWAEGGSIKIVLNLK